MQANPEHFLLFLLPAVGAVLTAFYMFRMWFLTFAGEPRGFPTAVDEAYAHATTRSTPWPTTMTHEHAHDDDNAIQVADDGHGHGHGHDLNPAAHAHESEPIMTWPLIILAV